MGTLVGVWRGAPSCDCQGRVMKFEYTTKNAAYVRQHGRCAKCGKYLNMTFEDRRGHEGAWTAHDLVPMDEGGSNKAHNCVILCITDPDCHRNFAHGGDPQERVFLTQFAFPHWLFRNGSEKEGAEATADNTHHGAEERTSSVVPYRMPRSTNGPWTTSSAAGGSRPLSRSGMGR
jgi:hypothetical protein